MLYFLYGPIIVYIFEKIKTKIYCRVIHTSIKLIQYHKEWHIANDNIINVFIDWILL